MIRKIAGTLLATSLLFPVGLWAQKPSELTWRDAKAFRIMGRTMVEPMMHQTDSMAYTRLPWSEKESYRSELWYLGRNSAGIAVRFSSNSKTVGVRWTVWNSFAMNHMAATGVRGVDLYVLHNNEWRFAGAGIPVSGKENEKILISGMNGEEKEFLLHLPLYDGVVKLEIGIDTTAHIGAPKSPLPLAEKPIVCYGTSITQGGCATRPGMAYPAILMRFLQREVINLGFSGNGRMDESIGTLMTQIDAGAFLIDCLGNCTQELIDRLGYHFVSNMLKAKPNTPIYMVEHPLTPAMTFSAKEAETINKKNEAWRDIYERLIKERYQNLYYVSAAHLTGVDAEATVDGIHLTDLGFLRMAELLAGMIKINP